MNKEVEIKNINGTPVALYPIEGLGAVGVDFRIKAGSWYEKGKIWGKTHLLEHMMFQGTERFADHDAMEVFKEEYGIWNNAWTGGSQVELALRMPSGSVQHGVELAGQMLFDLTIQNKDLEKQKKVVRQEYEDRISRATARFWEARVRQLFGEGHIYGRDGIGKPDCFENVTREELIQLSKELFVPANMVVGVAGNFDKGMVIDKLEKILCGNGVRQQEVYCEARPNREKLTHIEANMSTATVELDWLGDGFEKTSLEGRLRLGLASYLFGGSGRSILYKEVREKMGLAYSARSSTNFYPHIGMFSVDTSVKKENVEKVVEKVKSLLKHFVDTPIEKETFERAKRYLIMQREMAYESAMGTASAISDNLFWEGRVLTLAEYESIAGKTNEAEIRDILRKFVENQEPVVGVMMSRDK